MKTIYLDHAATCPVDPVVTKAMAPFMQSSYGNPSSFHSKGLEAKREVDKARESIAEHLNCRADEVLFTSGGTEDVM